MLSHMSSELIEIDPNALRALLRARGLTRYDLAKKLDMSTKTVQRWLNESVRRIRLDTLEKLAAALDTNPDQLKKSSTSIAQRTTNRALEELTSRDFVKKIRTTGDWQNYLNILKSFAPHTLSSELRLSLYKYIGISSYHLRKFRACRMYLNQAIQIADTLEIPTEQLDIMNWQALREETTGNFAEAQRYFDKAEQLLTEIDDPCCHALFYYKKSRLFHQMERYEEALICAKKSILLDYSNPDAPPMLNIALNYLQMGTTYLHLRNYAKARVMFLRNIQTAEKAGWVRGIFFAHFYLGLLQAIKESRLTNSHFGKARMILKLGANKRYDHRIAQFEFIYLVLQKRYDEAKHNIAVRLKKNRNSRLHFSYTVLDALLLEKLKPELLHVRRSYVEVAIEFFKRNHTFQALELTKKLTDSPRLEISQFLELYPF